MPIEAIRDHRLINIIRNAARADLFSDAPSLVGQLIHGAARLIDGCIGIVLGEGDPNDIRLDGDKGIGLTKTPVSTENGRRRGARERVQRVIASGKYALKVEYDALATRVIFEDKRATGVEYLKGRNLYHACPKPLSSSGERREAKARREVILCAGASATARLEVGSRSSTLATPRRRCASAAIMLASTAKASPPTIPSFMQRATDRPD